MGDMTRDCLCVCGTARRYYLKIMHSNWNKFQHVKAWEKGVLNWILISECSWQNGWWNGMEMGAVRNRMSCNSHHGAEFWLNICVQKHGIYWQINLNSPMPFILRHPCRTIFKDIQFQLIREQENIFPQKPRIIYLIFILNPPTFPLPCSLGRRITFYTSVFIGVAGRILTMITSDNYVLFSISAVLGSLTSISIFQAPLIIAMETSEP